MNYFEIIFAVLLFFIYFILWKIKKITLKKTAGVDPDVMSVSSSNLQIYMHFLVNFMTIYAVIILIIHAAGFQYNSLFTRYGALNGSYFDIAGFFTGLTGLGLCLYAQVKMGKSWRVGIDEKVRTELITTGLYKVIRNPTYLGLILLNAGIWLIWPTWTIFILNLIFVLFLEIQVRCEEDFLVKAHGKKYEAYKSKTKRYIPFIY